MAQPAFISFEGGEGCGKTTQSKLLKDSMQKAGFSVLHTREPGGEEGAEAIRTLLVTGDPKRWDSMAETLLFLAARTQHVERLIKPALKEGSWVISDRFHDSTRVYQGKGKGVEDRTYMRLHREVLGDFMPTLTFLLDISPEIGLGRALARHDSETRFESMELRFHEDVRQGFLELAKQEEARFCVMDAQEEIEVLHERIIARMAEQFELSLPLSSV